ncbi:MAG TPA: hypothetical protein VE890_18055, partial [Thermoguttaceae bacterium]|nr:hypothetical protein [Thermoguttaceae bacterium]
MPYGDQRYSDATGLLVGAGLLAAGLVVAQPDEKKRREREAREIRRLLFGRSDDGAAPELPLDEPPLPESSGDENWSEQIDQLCETLFHGEEEPEDLFTPEPPGAMHHACVGMPSPHATPDIPPV